MPVTIRVYVPLRAEWLPSVLAIVIYLFKSSKTNNYVSKGEASELYIA